MPRISIYLSQETMAALKAYLEKHYPNKRATSLVVEQAIKEWLRLVPTAAEGFIPSGIEG